jgi:hypothetical protein
MPSKPMTAVGNMDKIREKANMNMRVMNKEAPRISLTFKGKYI